MKYDSDIYIMSDATGEKAYEEFYVSGEKIDMQHFINMGVAEQTTRHDMEVVNAFFTKREGIFACAVFTKA